jgi:[acyl-carrier-protein] S-malonyltransferase
MRTATELGVERIIEFGGGIGKGELPAEKKPNLQSIINKNLRALEHESDYLPAINADTLRAAAEMLAANSEVA